MTAAGVACGICGTALRDSAKFCDACGARLAAPVTAAEYKQVTVLFADAIALDGHRGRRWIRSGCAN